MMITGIIIPALSPLPRHEHPYQICYANSHCTGMSSSHIKDSPRIPPQLSIHFIFSFTHEAYGRATSISNIASIFHSPGDYTLPDSFPVHPQVGDDSVDSAHRANATFVILCRNSDIHGAVRSIRSIEDRFNRKYRYPYVFLNEEPFTDEFKEYVPGFFFFFFHVQLF